MYEEYLTKSLAAVVAARQALDNYEKTKIKDIKNSASYNAQQAIEYILKYCIYNDSRYNGNSKDMANRQAYVLQGSLTQIFKSFDGITAWIVGMILVDRTKKDSRAAAKAKLVYALKLGASIIMFPEGTWNKSPNQLMSGLFPGVYDVAKESGALVVPIATYRNGKKSYGIMEEAFDICEYDRTEGITVLRDKLAAMRYELMEQYGRGKRSDFPYGEEADAYWKKYVDDLMAEAEFYDYDIELHTKYIDKNIVSPQKAFTFMDNLIPNKANAFLFRRK